MLVLPETTSYLGGLQPPNHTSSHPAKYTQATGSGTFEGRTGPQFSPCPVCAALSMPVDV